MQDHGGNVVDITGPEGAQGERKLQLAKLAHALSARAKAEAVGLRMSIWIS